MKISLVSLHKTDDLSKGSGVPYFLTRHLRKKAQLVLIDGLYRRYTAKRALAKGLREIFGKHFLVHRTRKTAKRYSAEVEESISRSNVEAILSLNTQPVAYLNSPLPVIIYHDATFANLLNSYSYCSGLFKSAIRAGHELESTSLNNADHLVWTNEWAYNSARDFYGISEKKMSIIPRGANLIEPPERDDLKFPHPGETLNLVFVCTDWERKGGSIVIQAMREIRKAGQKVELTICGTKPPGRFADDEFNYLGFIDKSNEEDLKLYGEALNRAHFLLLPTRADTAPIIINEAQAFGTPAVTADVGGVSTLVKDDYNGFLLPSDAEPEEYSKVILEVFSDENRYSNLCQNSRKEYEERLNWPKSSDKLLRIAEELL